MELRRWQKEALSIFLEKKFLIAEVATGCGKTFFAAKAMKELLKKNPKHKFLIVVPKIVIMNGWLKELYEFFDITELSCYNGELKEYSKITITTTQSLKNIALDLFDVLILDEAHNMFSPKLLALAKKEGFKYKLALSATVYNENYKHFQFEKVFNHNKYKYDISEALKDEVLNKFEWYDHEVVLDIFTRSDYEDIVIQIRQQLGAIGGFDRYLKLKNDDPRKATLNKLFDKRNKLIFNYEKKFKALTDIVEKNKNRKIIIFNQYNAIGDKIVNKINSLGFDCRIINSTLDDYEKRKRIKDFNDNKYNILVTSKMFDEGYNLPALDTAIIFSGESGLRQSVQRVGRILRLKDYNSKVYQIYCKKTFEHNYSDKRGEYFKSLAEKTGVTQW